MSDEPNNMSEEANIEPIVDESDNGELITCSKCGQLKPAHHANPHMCVDCTHAENNRLTYYRQHQGDWIAEAKAQGLEPWLQQPGETQWEYTVWTAYRDSYPGRRPTYAAVAKQLNTSYSVVNKISQRWSFPARMQLWMIECDRITMLQRRDEILNMNKEHVDMAARLRSKMSAAIDGIIPEALKPSEIASLMRISADLERKARVDTLAQEELRRDLVVDVGNPELKKKQTNQGDLKEVLDILMKAGALGSITTIGVKETTTTTREVIARDDTGTEATIMQGDEDE